MQGPGLHLKRFVARPSADRLFIDAELRLVYHDSQVCHEHVAIYRSLHGGQASKVSTERDDHVQSWELMPFVY